MHRASLLRVVPLLLAAALAAACNNDTGVDTEGDTVGDCTAKLSKGDLVITEIMPDPAGADDNSFEWFEVYNPGDSPVSLGDLGIEYSKVDGTDAKGHLIKDDALSIGPGQYFVFGKAAQDTRPEHVDYGYAADLGSFGNSDGKLRVVCGDVVVDEALYQDPEDGVSRSLGKKPPDAVDNDDLANWCLATELYSGEDYGTPGAENPDCALPLPACGECYDNDLLRPVHAPTPGQIIVTEVMPNANLTDATAGEWFEVYVTAGDVDLNCLQFGGNTSKFLADPAKPEKVLMEPQCINASAGTYVVFAEHVTWQKANFEAKITLVDSPSASNPNPGVYIAYDGQIIDEVHYTSTSDGAAWSLDPDSLTTTGNDDPINWCLATTPFDEGDLGSPGDENPQCPVAAKDGTCIDGDVPRDIHYAAPGDLIVTEVLTDPMLGDTANAEWIELRVGADIDLNGLTFGKTLDAPYATVADPSCIPIAADSYVLIARSADAAQNGGIPTPDWVDKISLTNDDSTLVVGVDNKLTMTQTELDQVSWATTADGKSRQLPLDLLPAAVPFDVAINDDPTQWCDGPAPFGLGDFGTPKAENLGCGDLPPPDDECIDPDTQQLRPIVHPSVGDLLITELHPDPDALLKSGGAGEPTGEWFELYAATGFDLNGLDLGKTFPTVLHTVTSATCIPVAADSYVLLSSLGKPTNPVNPADLAGNGGLPTPDYEYAGLSLTNTGGGLFVSLQDTQLDAVTYTKATVGKAHQLGTAADCITAAPLDTACNDDFAASWCPASSPYGLGDSGTPRAENIACGGGNVDPMCFDQGLQAMRLVVSPKPGDLVINEFLADPTIVTDANGEWFELKVLADVDLNDLKIINKANVDMATLAAAKPTLVSPDCLPAAAGSVQLFAHQADPMVNGNLPPVDHVVSTSLGNASGGISIGKADVLLHTVGWTVLQKPGKSSLLDPDGLADPMNISADGPPWCVAVDAGTPKQENPQCP